VKKVIAIGLIIAMSLQCLYKLGIITYFQINREYIADVLCINKEESITMCYGQCFLEKRLELADDATTDENPLPQGNQKVDFPIFLISEILNSSYELVKIYCAESHYIPGISSEHPRTPFRPPAQIS
jgi:hypothetical protein